MSDEKNAIQYPDVQVIRAQARALWEKQERKRIGIQERIGQSVPWWLVLIAAVFFLLSAPHTAATFDKLTPGWGWVAPVGVEFGLLYAAFMRQQRSKSNGLKALEMLLFLTAVIVNGAGAFISVIERVNALNNMPMGEIVGNFGSLPATAQVALVLVPFSALIIPIGTGVAGEGLATLILERRQTGDLLETRWKLVRAEIEFYALRDAAIGKGIPVGTAKKWAAGIVGGTDKLLLPAPDGTDKPDSGGAPDGRTDNRTDGQTDKRTDGQVPALPDGSGHSGQPQSSGRGYAKRSNAREVAREFLATNPEAVNLSVRDFAAAAGIGKTTAAEVLNEFRAGQNAE